MIEDFRSQAEDLFFALHSTDNDEATRREIENDFVRFKVKLEAAVSRGDLRKGIADALLRVATG